MTNLMGRPLIYLALVAGLGLSLLPLGRMQPPVETTHFFTETGFPVVGRFLDAWRGPYTYQESVAINGYPISGVQDEVNPTDHKTYRVQWFQRARYELHPEKPPPDDVQFGLLGTAAAQVHAGEPAFAPVPRPADLGPALAWFPETQHTISAVFLQFWTRYGSWKQLGFPISEPFMEQNRSDGHSYPVQYFERSRLESHPGQAPAFGDVLLGQLGVAQYRHVPAGVPPATSSPVPAGP